jgi:EAL domain-containing protein (putative c-di-GMP-specific phosphodiesterase class I)
MGLKVVAEGVEEVIQMDVLKQLGCDKVQGYLISRPVPKQAVEELLETQRRYGIQQSDSSR